MTGLSRVEARLGALRPTEIYAYVPALELGGEEMPDALQRVQALEHLSLLAQLHR